MRGYYLPLEIFENNLKTIRGIRFTRREIDVIAFAASGRSSNTAASFFKILPKTVANRLSDAMDKVECRTREALIDYIQKCPQFFWVKQYYISLLLEDIFQKSLKKISTLFDKGSQTCCLVWLGEPGHCSWHVVQLKKHLELSGIKAINADQIDNKDLTHIIHDVQVNNTRQVIITAPDINCLSNYIKELSKKGITSQQLKDNFTFLSVNNVTNNNAAGVLNSEPSIDSVSLDEYYNSFFFLLKKLLPNIDLSQIQLELSNQLILLYPESNMLKPPFILESFLKKEWYLNAVSKYVEKKPVWVIFILILLGVLILMFKFHGTPETPEQPVIDKNVLIRSDLLIPKESMLLKRQELIHKIDDGLKGDGIRVVALVGIGGAGKTTIARQYVIQQRAPIIWEINAETHESLAASLEKFAYSLSVSEEDAKTLRRIKGIINTGEKNYHISCFVRDKLKSFPAWYLIYDNVGKFSDIQEYFPRDINTWGYGKVIITSQDNNINNNKYINETFLIGELRPEQKLNLFIQIMNNGRPHPFSQKEKDDAIVFLTDIPSFPLDVSIAAYYIKATNISYEDYIKKIYNNNKEYENILENILKESGDYNKTRYCIISMSLDKIMNIDTHYKDLLFFLSLIDYKDIPRGLLSKFKNEDIIDSFIYNLKKYSLIVTDIPHTASNSTFTIHHSTQAITLDYVLKKLNNEEKERLLNLIITHLANYSIDLTENENLLRMNGLIKHYESLLKNVMVAKNARIRGAVECELGIFYYYLNHYEKARIFVERGIKDLNNDLNNNNLQNARYLKYLGIIEREQGGYEKSKAILEKSLQIYKKYYSEEQIEVAQVLTFLGIVNRDLSDQEQARTLLEKAVSIYNNHPNKNKGIGLSIIYLANVYTELGYYEKGKNLLEDLYANYFHESQNYLIKARILINLANSYFGLGQYEKSQKLYEQGLLIYKNHYAEDHAGMGWVLAMLGRGYCELQYLNKSITYLQESRAIFKKKFSEKHGAYAWASYNLANAYREQGNSQKARKLIEEILPFLRQKFGDTNIRTMWALHCFAKVLRDQGLYAESRKLLEKTLVCYKKIYGHSHIQTAKALGDLGKTYLVEGQLENAEKYLQQALEILKQNNHCASYIVLKDLSDLYLQKSIYEEEQGNKKNSKRMKQEYKNYLNSALETIKLHFPENKDHIVKSIFNLPIFRNLFDFH